ncbi:MAG TPA: S24/S26 family peptidase [Thermoanaerobaculia bacterium]|nr:S24/S26 family peptidase [Thermoanaerobaculia bacterium]
MSEFEPTLRELLLSGHAARFHASGDSMYPSIRGGDHLHIVPCGTSELRRGDVVLAATERGLTAHRIVRIRERGGSLRITTRGDNSLRSDRPVEAADILGRVAQIERGTNVRQSIPKSATIIRIAAVLIRRLRVRFQQ